MTALSASVALGLRARNAFACCSRAFTCRYWFWIASAGTKAPDAVKAVRAVSDSRTRSSRPEVKITLPSATERVSSRRRRLSSACFVSRSRRLAATLVGSLGSRPFPTRSRRALVIRPSPPSRDWTLSMKI